MYRIITTVLIAGVFITPFITSAETVLRTGESISVETDQIVEDDFYAAAGTISMSGSVLGDMYVAGGSVTANGDVAEDLTIFAGSAQVHASVTDDVRVAAGEIIIAEHVGGDVFVFGGLLKILSSASIDGDVFFYGGEVEINAPVGGSVMGTADSIRIDAAVGGDVDMIASRSIVLGDRASISGDVRYKGASDITRAQNAVVEGEVIKNIEDDTKEAGNRASLISIIVTLFATLSLYLLFKDELQRFAKDTLENGARSGLIGLGTLFAAPIVSILLMVTVLGLLVGVLSMFLLLLLYTLAFILMSVIAGALAAQLFTKTCSVNLLWILAGVVAIQALLLIPVIGPFAVFILFVMTLGGLVYRAYRIFGQ